MAIELKKIEPKVANGSRKSETRIHGISATEDYENKRRQEGFNGCAVMLKRDYQALATFRYALLKFFGSSELAAARYGLSMLQYEALLTIYGFPGREEISIGEMAEWLQIKYRSVVDLVDLLESEGLVCGKTSKEDRFTILIRITNKGRRVLEKLAALNKKELQMLQSQIRQLSDLL